MLNVKTGTFQSFDGQGLFYREWEHDVQANGKIVLLLHRGHEHSERLNGIAAKKAFAGYKVFSYDNRGHGYTEGEPAFEFMDMVRDLEAFVAFLCEKERKESSDFFIIANSVAGVVASTWMHDFAPKIAGAALVAPAFKIKLYFPFACEFLKLAIRVIPKLNIKSYVKARFLTHDVIEQQKYNDDTLITPNIPARQLTTLLDTAKRVVKNANFIATPILVLSATKDYVVDSAIQGDFYAELASSHKKFVQLDGFYHGVLYEKNNQLALDEIAGFMEQCFQREPDNGVHGMIKSTSQERDKLAYGSQRFLEKVNCATQRVMMARLGFLSKGISIGMCYGFDSGVTLDHVYKNIPEGQTWVGKWIDKNYLNSIGWQGIRRRKANLKSSLKEKIAVLQQAGEQVKILDIAGGPARYLIEIAEQYKDVSIQVRDYQIQNIEEGRNLAKDRGLINISYEQCDAFDIVSYSQDKESPNIVIVSGVFELFSDNDRIDIAIKGVASILKQGGYLLYTGQPWHPQLAQIANVLGNHRQKQWIMRRRSQYELDYLFSRRGFKKETMKLDDWGIFTVSTARRV